ncbi:adenylyltransferase/cytidyltransferase family protein [Nitrosomonas sp. Nm166]|uniref:adenylyltransferase/cytidyltransferase family protein n=1 Tax=Nitrosomonas sp. Nm166 TaxID=1881054 RepID=UPI0008EC43E5|nr:adenylyltransferase/cytidyltransferase family protein [Nitrosomonas sp. Nm166]SFE17599.1 cytidyltransferase-like domain-containing protein [Nitrosomonas sp. Nm166]
MSKKLDELLLKAKDLIATCKLNDADRILGPLKQEHPLSQDVARLWCSLAMRTDRAADVLPYAARIYAHVQSDFHKAHWAHVLGTASFILLDLSEAHMHFIDTLNHLMALAKAGKVPPLREKTKTQRPGGNVFVSGEAEKLLWTTCVKLAKLRIPAFPFAGTLLGLVRNGCLLDFDKDLDIAVWMDSWDACCVALEEAGWVRAPMRIEYANYRDYVHPELGITLDVCGLQARGQQIISGFSLPKYSAEYQRVSVFPQFDLIQHSTDYGAVWFPRQPEKILAAFYGDWRTPNPHWDTVISARNLENFTLLVRCYAYHRLAQHWLSGNLTKAWCYAHQIALKDPDDVLALRSRQWLERALTRLNREIPVWPGNQPQKRVYTRMVADLFHEGHVNFLRAARALGTHLTVCVVSDERVVESKGKLPVMKQAERAAVVAACKYVDAVMTETPASVTVGFMQKNGFDIYTFACASEHERLDKYQLCATLPAEMIQELAYTPGISTSELVMRILDGAGSKAVGTKSK